MKKPTKKPSKKLSARARKQDVPLRYYHALKRRVTKLESEMRGLWKHQFNNDVRLNKLEEDSAALEAVVEMLVKRVHEYLKGKK